MHSLGYSKSNIFDQAKTLNSQGYIVLSGNRHMVHCGIEDNQKVTSVVYYYLGFAYGNTGLQIR